MMKTNEKINKIIQEFKQALDDEIHALKLGKGSGIVLVTNGKFLKKTLEFYIYQFHLENFIVVLEDTPAILDVDGREFECEIISVNGQLVQISVKEKLESIIHKARIKTNTWYLLELLKKKYEEYENEVERFATSYKLFSGYSENIKDANRPQLDLNTFTNINSNISQQKAIFSSINNSISILWGPPGTGKTATIAQAIYGHMNLGRKILLLSHANNAVDQALEKVAFETKKFFYKDCKLVRLGTPKAEMLQKFETHYPLVLLDKIAEHKSSELIAQKRKLSLYLEKLNSEIEKLKNVVLDVERLKELIKSIQQEEIACQNIEHQIHHFRHETRRLQYKSNELKRKLETIADTSGFKKIIFGLDPNKIKSERIDVIQKVNLNSNQIQKLKELLNVHRNRLKDCKNSNHQLRESLRPKVQKYSNFKEITKILEDLETQRDLTKDKIDEINTNIENIKNQILDEAQLVATTLSKSYLSKEIDKIQFDILIVDETSMAPLPMLFWSASKVKKGITIVGDFKQLPPICISREVLAQKWLKRNIFDVLGINQISKACSDHRVVLLDTQYRMNPLISQIPKREIYNGRLMDAENTSTKTTYDKVSGNSPICLVDTSLQNPWCSQFDRGRFNLISGLISIELASIILDDIRHNKITVGIITPYQKHARLLLRIAEDRNLFRNNNLRINTVHSFQGGEEEVIIFDSVEGLGSKKWSILNDYDNLESSKLLLNVALTRASSKLYLVANCNYFTKVFPPDTMFLKVLNHFRKKGKVVPSTELFNGLKDSNFEYWVDKINSTNKREFIQGSSFTADEFWPSFLKDLSHVNDELIIFSPFLTIERVGKLSNYFIELLSKNINIYVITLSPNEQPAVMRDNARNVLEHLKSIGVIVKFRKNMHEKIALIDRKIKWIGSLNILSHNTRTEYMERVVGERSANELFEKFKLESLLKNTNRNGDTCPMCSVGYIVTKKQRKYPYKEFFGCSRWPKCEWLENSDLNGRNAKKNMESAINSNIRSKSFDSQIHEYSISQTQISKNQYQDSINRAEKSNVNEWESKLLYWSSVKKTGYRFSAKKNAWWKKKEI
ncbi:MAG: hypothetical protein DWQ05_07185 [Calditrichaeota bacterium]|nr:MAG: hypothetical protein DWQ05_07185 [Calditrichota bacterium]